MIRLDARKPATAPVPAAPPDEDGVAAYGALFHLGLWGGSAAACLLVVAIASWTQTGQTRLAAAYASLTGTEQAVDPQFAERERQIAEARRTAETIRNLTQDRDRLLARMTVLERNYEDVTGSVGKLAGPGKPLREPGAAAVTSTASVSAGVALDAAPASPPSLPVASAPATTPAATPSPPIPDATIAPTVPQPPEPKTAKRDFGVDLGGGATISTLRNSWDRIRRNHASLLDGLRPLIAVRDGRGGQVELRLVVGPIGNAADAARLCASLAATGLSCQPTMFEGQRLASR